ncbi:MAG: helix-turn-helix transcriptional regulator [Deferribacteraceae bacterium]|jgi:DNA-binding CsgD family transcriptional regulator|nr:helix-turn-helix transcriptional regulator [Deferribacteraceae bacterium]
MAYNLAVHAFDKLSGQELRLAELIMQGYTQKEIVEILKISDNTVRGYRKSLYSKLQIHSRKELFELAEMANKLE